MGRGGDAIKVELSEEMVIAGHLTLAFVDLEEDTCLVVSVGAEDLLLLGGNACVSWNNSRKDTADDFDTLGEGCDIEEEEVLDLLAALSGEDGSLNGVDGSVELLAVEEFLEHGLDLGDSGGTTDEDDLVDQVLGDVRVLEDLLYGGHALLEVGHAELLELCAGHVDVEILTLGKSLTV